MVTIQGYRQWKIVVDFFFYNNIGIFVTTQWAKANKALLLLS